MKTRLIILSLLILLLGVQQISAQTTVPDIDISIGGKESSDESVCDTKNWIFIPDSGDSLTY